LRFKAASDEEITTFDTLKMLGGEKIWGYSHNDLMLTQTYRVGLEAMAELWCMAGDQTINILDSTLNIMNDLIHTHFRYS
jgi:hypothetical protein